MKPTVAWVVMASVAVAACGRFGFSAQSTNDASTATTGDAPRAPDGKLLIGSDAAGSGCAFQLCDGFEGSDLDPVWMPTSTGVSIDSTVAHAGAQSLHVHTDAVGVGDGSLVYIEETATFATPSPVFYVRAFLRVGATPVDNMGLIEANQTSGSPDGDGLFLTSAGFTVYTEFAERSQDTTFVPTIDAWVCAVWSVVRSTGSTGSETVTGDITTTSLTNLATDGSPALNQIDLGILFANSTDTSPQPAIDAWIDDVIVSTTPVTCAD